MILVAVAALANWLIPNREVGEVSQTVDLLAAEVDPMSGGDRVWSQSMNDGDRASLSEVDAIPFTGRIRIDLYDDDTLLRSPS